jgi:outer membrane protein
MKLFTTNVLRLRQAGHAHTRASLRRLGRCAIIFWLAQAGAPAAETNFPAWLSQPMSMADALKLSLLQNGAVLKGESELEASQGIVLQTRSVAFPKIRGAGGYLHTEAVEKIPFDSQGRVDPQRDQWVGGIRVVQSIYEGGRIRSALRSARLTREQALLQYQTIVSDTLLQVRSAYYDVLLAAQQIVVQEASVKLLEEQLANTKRRFDAGAVTRLDVVRGEVELANTKPRLIRARNAHRIAKNNLATDLGYSIPPNVWEDIPMILTDKLEGGTYEVDLPGALSLAAQLRPELGVLRKEEALRKEAIVTARAETKPSIGIFGGYGAHNSRFDDSFTSGIGGPTAGIELTWNMWDSGLTRGRVMEAAARLKGVEAELDERMRRVSVQVRSAYSSFLEAREVLESQKKVQEQAEEALRLATSRYDAGTSIQLDLLNAQTALTEARTTQVQALYGYEIARARLEHAIGLTVTLESARLPEKSPISKP